MATTKNPANERDFILTPRTFLTFSNTFLMAARPWGDAGAEPGRSARQKVKRTWKALTIKK